jgi:4'-phosphopantetheinyl transferase
VVHAFYSHIAPLYNEETYRFYYERCPFFRQHKADRIRDLRHKAQSIGVWVLLETAWDRLGLCGHPNNTEGVFAYNLSHSGEYVLCAISDTDDHSLKIGCDVEIIKEAKLILAKRFFAKDEYEKLLTFSDDKELLNRRFYRFWVLKESLMKATGQGMKIPLDEVEIMWNIKDMPVLKGIPRNLGDAWYFREFQIPTVDFESAVPDSGIKEDFGIINEKGGGASSSKIIDSINRNEHLVDSARVAICANKDIISDRLTLITAFDTMR